MDVDTKRLIFVGGLHRSGTTPLSKVLGEHNDISCLSKTGVAEDEGQHLQSVYPPALHYGGSGHFARRDAAHLTESSPLVTTGNAAAILKEWEPYWDLSRRYLLEKSPPNLLMSRFLQALYPDALFVMVVRHPVTVALSTKKWAHLISRNPRKFASLTGLVEHWLIAHRLLVSDLPHLGRVHIVHYEDLVQQPEVALAKIQQFLGLQSVIPSTKVSGSHGSSYQEWWNRLRSLARPGGWQRRLIERRYTTEIASFGYDMEDLSNHSPQLPQLLA